MALFSDLEREERPPSNSAMHAQRQQPHPEQLLAAGELFIFCLITKDEMGIVSQSLFKRSDHHIEIMLFDADGSFIPQPLEFQDQVLQLVE